MTGVADSAPSPRVLITGGAGFVGARLARACVARGLETFVTVRPGAVTPRLAALEGRVRPFEVDLRDPAAMRAVALSVRPTLAFHLGWEIGPGVHDDPRNLDCLAGSMGLLRGLADGGCGRCLVTGTYLEYAPTEADVDEDAVIRPRNLYATTKHALHEVARAFASSRGASLVWARLFNVYGPAEHPWALVPYVSRQLLAGLPCALTLGDQVRGFLHVDDAADALLALGLSDFDGAVNVGADVPTSVREVASELARLARRPDLLEFGVRAPSAHDAPRVVARVARLREGSGFTPRVPLGEGLADALAYWRDPRAYDARRPA